MAIVRHDGTEIPRDPEPWDPHETRWQGISWADMVAQGASLGASEWLVPSGWVVNATQADVTIVDRYGTEHEHVNRANITAAAGEEVIITNRQTLTYPDGEVERLDRSVQAYIKDQ